MTAVTFNLIYSWSMIPAISVMVSIINIHVGNMSDVFYAYRSVVDVVIPVARAEMVAWYKGPPGIRGIPVG